MKQQWFELQVTVPGRPVARRVFQGFTVDDALAAAKRQFPAAEIEVPAPAAKAALAHSKNGPKQTYRQIQALLK